MGRMVWLDCEECEGQGIDEDGDVCWMCNGNCEVEVELEPYEEN